MAGGGSGFCCGEGLLDKFFGGLSPFAGCPTTIVPSPFFPQDVNSNTMIGAHGYCTQELVNLALTGGLLSLSSLINPERTVVRRSILAFPTDPTSTKKHATHPAHQKGRACSNVFDGQKDLGEGMLLKGLTKRSDPTQVDPPSFSSAYLFPFLLPTFSSQVGFISLFEHYEYVHHHPISSHLIYPLPSGMHSPGRMLFVCLSFCHIFCLLCLSFVPSHLVTFEWATITRRRYTPSGSCVANHTTPLSFH